MTAPMRRGMAALTACILIGSLAVSFAAPIGAAGSRVGPRAPGDTGSDCENVGPPTKTGNNRDNVIRGTAGDDVIFAKGGDDVIKGRGGADTLCGQDGKDTIIGGAGENILVGGAGANLLRGGPEGEDLLAFGGNDELIGDDGNDYLIGGNGDDDEGDAGPGTDACSGVETLINCEGEVV